MGIGELIKWRDEDLPLKNNPFAYMGGGKDKKSLVERIKEEVKVLYLHQGIGSSLTVVFSKVFTSS